MKKFGETDAANIKRLDALEERIGGKVAASVESALDGSVATRLKHLEAQLDAKTSATLSSEIGKVHGAMAASGRSWVLPFGVLLALLAAMFAYGARTYNKMKKTHLL
jgi:hypothetical protein